MNWFRKSKSVDASSTRKHARPGVEKLEAREVLYSASGNAWPHPELITIGFVPDGTVVGADVNGPITSNLSSAFNARFGSPAAWQNQILKAAQAWAQQTNLNFALVSDSGADIGSGLYQQGDPSMADIRIGGYNFGAATLAQAYMPAPVNNTSYAGDIQFNTGQTWNIGTQYDLYTVALHEFGHVLGLYHSGVVSAAMYGSYSGTKTVLNADDITGIRAVAGYDAGDFTSPGYQGARKSDGYDATASNGTSAAASDITAAINPVTRTALVQNLNITATSDVDYYKFTVPAGLGGTLTVKAQSTGLSLLAPTLTLYNSSQAQLATQTAGTTDYDGSTLSVTYSVTAGQTYYVKVAGVNATATGTGSYALALGLAGTAAPTAAPPATQTLNGLEVSAGGGQATKTEDEFRVNSYTAGTQETGVETRQAVAMDATGNYVAVWSSLGQDGSGYGVYAQRFDSNGNPRGGEFRVNATTAGDQTCPAVAMNDSGSFVVAWVSGGQDGSGAGVYAQRCDPLGVAMGGEFRVNTTTAGDQTNPVVAIDTSGKFVIAWQSAAQDGSGCNILAQRVNANGMFNGNEFQVNTYTSGDQVRPSVAQDDAGNIIFTWSSNGQDGGGQGVYGQRFTLNGQKIGTEFRVNTATANDQDYSSVAVSPLGEFVVTWSSNLQDGGGWGTYAQRYDALGVAQGGEFRVNTATVSDQKYSSVALDNEANFVITWSSFNADGASSWGVYGQQYLANGQAAGGELRINTSTSGNQEAASVAIASTGDAVAVWRGAGATDGAGIFAQMYKLANGSGLSPMGDAGEPHGYGPDGCCGHDHMEEPEGDSCACATCSTAVAVVQPHDGEVRQIIGSNAGQGQLINSLLAATGGFRGTTVADQHQHDRQEQDQAMLSDFGVPPVPGSAANFAVSALPSKKGQPAIANSFCISAPAFGSSWQWLSPLSWG